MDHEISAAEPEGIDLEPPGLISRFRPGFGLGIDLEAPAFHVDIGIGGVVIQGGGKTPDCRAMTPRTRLLIPEAPRQWPIWDLKELSIILRPLA